MKLRMRYAFPSLGRAFGLLAVLVSSSTLSQKFSCCFSPSVPLFHGFLNYMDFTCVRIGFLAMPNLYVCYKVLHDHFSLLLRFSTLSLRKVQEILYFQGDITDMPKIIYFTMYCIVIFPFHQTAS